MQLIFNKSFRLFFCTQVVLEQAYHFSINNLIKSLIGRKVTQTNGQKGEVVFINPLDVINPLVKVGDTFVDLSHDQQLHIQDIVV